MAAELKNKVEPLDEEHFYFEGVLIDIPNIAAQNPKSGASIHDFNESISNLRHVAYSLIENPAIATGPRTLGTIIVNLCKLHKLGIITGVPWQRNF